MGHRRSYAGSSTASMGSTAADGGGALGGAVPAAYYLAPELLRGGPPSVEGDVYAFGIVMFEVLSPPPLRGERMPRHPTGPNYRAPSRSQFSPSFRP